MTQQHNKVSTVNNSRRESPFVIPANDYLGNHVTVNGFYESQELTAVINFLKCHEFDFQTAIDAGANIGNHTLFFSKFFHDVLAFEINPFTFKLLKINTEHLKNVFPRFQINIDSTIQLVTNEIIPKRFHTLLLAIPIITQ